MKKDLDLDDFSVWLTTSQEEGGCGHICLLLEIEERKKVRYARFIQFDVELLRVSRQDLNLFELDHKRADIDPLKVLRSWAARIDELDLIVSEDVQTIFQRLIDRGDISMKKKFQTTTDQPAAESPKDANPESTTRPVTTGSGPGITKEQAELMEKVGQGALKVARKHAKKKAETEGSTTTPAEGAADMAAAKKSGSKTKKASTSKKPAAKKASTSKKPAAKKAPSAATAKKASNGFDDDAKITVLVKENPKREGSEAHRRFKLYRTGMTVGDYLAKGGTGADLRWDSKHKSISVK